MRKGATDSKEPMTTKMREIAHFMAGSCCCDFQERKTRGGQDHGVIILFNPDLK